MPAQTPFDKLWQRHVVHEDADGRVLRYVRPREPGQERTSGAVRKYRDGGALVLYARDGKEFKSYRQTPAFHD